MKQYSILAIDLNPTKGNEKRGYRPCVVVSNENFYNTTGFVWVYPITSRGYKYPTDIEVKTKQGKVHGIIDTVQLKCVDISARKHKYIDMLDSELYKDVFESVIASTEKLD